MRWDPFRETLARHAGVHRPLDERPQPCANLSIVVVPRSRCIPDGGRGLPRILPTGVRPRVLSIRVTGEDRGDVKQDRRPGGASSPLPEWRVGAIRRATNLLSGIVAEKAGPGFRDGTLHLRSRGPSGQGLDPLRRGQPGCSPFPAAGRPGGGFAFQPARAQALACWPAPHALESEKISWSCHGSSEDSACR